MKKYPLPLLLASAVLVSSCLKDDYDFKDIKVDSDIAPTVAVPVAKASLTFGDLLDSLRTNDFISVDSDSLIWVRYEDSLFSYVAAELIDIPNQATSTTFPVSAIDMDDVIAPATAVPLSTILDGLPADQKAAMEAADGGMGIFPSLASFQISGFDIQSLEQFDWIRLDEGVLTLTFTNDWPVDIENFSLQLKNNGANRAEVGVVNIPMITAGSTQQGQILLDEKLLENDLVADITLESPGSGLTPVPIDLSSSISIGTNLADMVVDQGSAKLPSGLSELFNDEITMDLATNNGEELSLIQLTGGSIDYSFDYSIGVPVNITISIPALTQNGTGLTEVIVVDPINDPSTTYNGTINLAGYAMDMTNAPQANQLSASISATVVNGNNNVTFDISNDVSVSINISDIEVGLIQGYMGQQNFGIDPNTLEFNLFGDALDAELTLADPQITLEITNSIGIPVSLDLSQLEVYKGAQTLKLLGDDSWWTDRRISVPASAGQEAVTRVTINKDSSNIVEALKIQPEGITYGLNAVLNPDGHTLNNFITPESGLDVSLDVDIPLYAGMKGFKFEEEMDFDGESLANLKEAILHYTMENEFPVDVEIQMYFTDASRNVLDSLFDDGARVIIPSGEVDAVTGDVTSATNVKDQIVLSEELITSVKDLAKYILIKIELATANNGETPAKFKTDYGLTVELGLQATVKLELDK